MFKQSVRSPLRTVRAFSTSRSRTSRGTAATVAVVATTSILAYSGFNRVVQNDALQAEPSSSLKIKSNVNSDGKSINSQARSESTLTALVWGSNRSSTLSPDHSELEAIRTPTIASWLNNVALRDLALQQDHAACVDARGDVYQWGKGYSNDSKPSLTLRGMDIVQLQLTGTKVYALSASGKIYTLHADASKQQLKPGTSTPSSRWGSGWLWGEKPVSDFVEVVPREHLSWGEKFVSITAGDDHLLALTSSGRAFAHPVNKNANTFGQLGFRKFEVSDPSTPLSSTPITVELVPKSVADPLAKASPFKRTPSTVQSEKEDILGKIDDSTIRFCPTLFEIPSLRGIKVSELTAGGRSSFALTSTGRVLGWGANEFGQIGLGNNVTLDSITVPTEVILWRTAQPGTQTKCTSVSTGGDLTCFTVERLTVSPSTKTVDVLVCGNGQWGGLGNNTYSNAQGTPIRARNVSGLTEYDDEGKCLKPIVPNSIAVSRTGHVLLTLDTAMGRDLLAWGKNYDSELGNGRRSSAAAPVAMSTPDGERFMLRRTTAKEVFDLQGSVWKRGVQVEQKAVTGYCNSAVFWKICQ